ncbi:hypothetical protein KK083_31980 [Fulvivirgaceae bacterium PWU4]|uniref:Uncharacterized protein n=1 Tax=Chryseosolibacter histidini TaxID=2782349 RepID=A0AAP2GMJ6_9BACT|nr:hypothetical protein [Chryseosolibacter histidini]MBT1701556.1 hypothetical protein [Chryseosolibacter histidini]
MKTLTFFLLLLVTATLCYSQTTVPSAEVQIRSAVMAAPVELRDGAMVYGYSAKGEFEVIRKGTNGMVCLADDPSQKGFSVSCYHKDLDTFMERGRVLKKEGKSQTDIFNIREAEVKSGKLLMPKQPTSLFVYSTSDEKFDTATGEIKDGYLRYVIYIPFATAESTGLPLKPDVPGMPWLMDPGTHRAHIMITPPKE